MTVSRRTLSTVLAMAPLGPRLLRPAPARAQAAPIPVLATFSILGDIVRNVGGEAIALEVLVGPDGDAHSYEPTPSDIARVADATLIFENGIEFETWLDDIYASSDSAATRVVVTDGLEIHYFGEPNHGGDALPDGATPEASSEAEEGGERDPHVWHDIRNVIGEVAVIRDALSAADPANAATYRANADAYTAQLTELDTFARAEAAKLPPERRKLVTSHDALGYLADAYGFQVVGAALASFSTETADPSAGDIADLVEEIRATGVPAIFAENIEGTDLMRQIADDAGVALAPPLFTDALGQPGSKGATYVDMVRYDMTTIVTALGGA